MLDADVNMAEMLENQAILLSSDGLIDEFSQANEEARHLRLLAVTCPRFVRV